MPYIIYRKILGFRGFGTENPSRPCVYNIEDSRILSLILGRGEVFYGKGRCKYHKRKGGVKRQ
jgi:hypothetical protein